MKSLLTLTILFFSTSFLLLVSVDLTYAQHEDDSLRHVIQQSIQKAITLNIAAGKCAEVSLTLSPIFITFTSEGRIENVIFSESPECLYRNKGKIIHKLKKDVDELSLDHVLFKDKFIIAIVVLTLESYPNPAAGSYQDWDNLFKGIDEKLLSGKSLKYCLPITSHISRIKN